MDKCKVKKARLFLSIAFCILTIMFSLSFTKPIKASAGELSKELVNDEFTADTIDKAMWYRTDESGLEVTAGSQTVLKMNKPSDGTSITSNIKQSGGAVVEVDIPYMLMNGGEGWMGVGFNLADNKGSVFLNAKDAVPYTDGLYFAYRGDVQQIVFASFKGIVTKFLDGSGNVIPQKTQWNFYDASFLADANEKNIIKNKTLRFTYGADGSIEARMRELGQTGEGDVVIKNDPSQKLKPFKDGSYTTLGFVNGAKPIDTVTISDFRIYDQNKAVVGKFTTDIAQLNKTYISFVSGATESFKFGVSNSMSFTKDYMSGNPMILRKKITVNDKNDRHTSNITTTINMSVKELKEGVKFGVATGIAKQSTGDFGDAKTSLLYLQKVGEQVKMGIDSYDADKTLVEVMPTTNLPGKVMASNLNFRYVVDCKGAAQVFFDADTTSTFSVTSGVYSDGYLAFTINGETSSEKYVEAGLSLVKLVNNFYDRPANSNISTNFDNDEFNTNDWILKSRAYMGNFDNGTYVKDGEYVFNNVAENSGLVTVNKYSNFELEFSITDLRREQVVDADNKVLFPPSSHISIMFGTTFNNDHFGNMYQKFPLICYEAPIDIETWDREKDASGNVLPTKVVAIGNGLAKHVTLPAKYDFWDASKKGEVLNFKITVVDKNVKVGFKYDFEEDYFIAADLTMKEALTGHVYILGMGNSYFVPIVSEGASCGNFKIDDITLNNLDDDANIVTYDFVSSKQKPQVDFPYVPKNNDDEYLISENKTGGCQSASLAQISAVLLALGVTFVVGKKW